MKTTSHILFFLLLSWQASAQIHRDFKHAFSLGASAYFFTGGPYPGGLAHLGPQYERIFQRKNGPALFSLQCGLHLLLEDGEAHAALPAEFNFTPSGKKVALSVGLGGVLHTGTFLLQPAIFPTIKLGLRVKLGRIFFLDAHWRSLYSYRYEGVSNTYSPPFRRAGATYSPGLAVGVGGYF